MAQEIRAFDVPVPANTPLATPITAALTMPPRIVDRIEIKVPPGPRGELGFALGAGGVAVLPIQAGQWLITDDEEIGWDVTDQLDSGGWQLFAYNTGRFAHTLHIRFLCRLPQTSSFATTAPAPLAAINAGAPLAPAAASA